MLAGLVTVVLILFWTTRLEDNSINEHKTFRDFYQRTKHAMDGKDSSAAGGSGPGLKPADRDNDGDIDADDELLGAEMQERLKAAEARAKEAANEKAGLRPDPPSHVVGVGSSADGQVGDPENASEVSEEERDAEAELNMILKKSPSKYCGRYDRVPC